MSQSYLHYSEGSSIKPLLLHLVTYRYRAQKKKPKSIYLVYYMMGEDWEETTVLVELNGLTDTEFLKKENVACRVLGVDSDKPLLQLGTNLFSGEYKDAIGTFLLLNKRTDQDESTIKSVDLHSITQKMLLMHRTFLNEKTDGDAETSSGHNPNVVKHAKDLSVDSTTENNSNTTSSITK